MNTRNDHSHDFSSTSPEEFLELFKFASTCDILRLEQITDPIKSDFVATLLASFNRWQEKRKGFDSELIQSIQYILCFEQQREQLTAVLFNQGPPKASQLETTFRLLFQVAYLRHQFEQKYIARDATST